MIGVLETILNSLNLNESLKSSLGKDIEPIEPLPEVTELATAAEPATEQEPSPQSDVAVEHVEEATAAAVFKRVTIEREPEHPNDSLRQILRELKEMNAMNFDDEQVRVTMKEDNPRHLIVTLAPVDGLYMDGQFEISMTLPDDYPNSSPSLECLTPISHPNVGSDGEICFSLLQEDSTTLRIADYAHGLLWLLYYPNLFSRLNGDCPRDEKEFAKMVRASIEGGEVAGIAYQRSPRLPMIEKTEEKETEQGVECVNLQNEKNGKKWEWRLVNEDWVQVFV